MTSNPCDICGRRSARYVCQNCGRRVCETCLDPWRWNCTVCQGSPPQIPAQYERGSDLMFKLFLSGFAIVFLGMILMFASSLMSGIGDTSGAAIVFIGPIPIGLGYGRLGLQLFVLAIIIAVVAFAMFWLMRRK